MPVTAIRCPHCGTVGKVKRWGGSRLRRCYNCGAQWWTDEHDND